MRHGQREGKRGVRKRAEEGLSEEGREENVKGVIPRRARTGQCTVYSQTIPQRGHWP